MFYFTISLFNNYLYIWYTPINVTYATNKQDKNPRL